ncbi:hypothetical protein K439DRAFT_1615580 [Ramaria rubella]|nr:hypothetical protein K439DRAFT_1615580 [Ramaria rubella]
MKSNFFLDLVSSYPLFAGNVSAIEELKWMSVGKADCLFDKSTDGEAAIIPLRHVSASCCYAGLLGVYSPNFGTLQDAKYKIMLGPPEDSALSPSWNISIDLLQKLEKSVAKTMSCKNILEEIEVCQFSIKGQDKPLKQKINSNRNIIYLADLFPNTDSSSQSTDSNTNVIDPETSTYPVPDEYMESYDKVKLKFVVAPLPVYHKDIFIEPADVMTILQGALVELHIALDHYKIFTTPPFDSFTAKSLSILLASYKKFLLISKRMYGMVLSNLLNNPRKPDGTPFYILVL